MSGVAANLRTVNNFGDRFVKKRRRPWMGREARSPEAATQRDVSDLVALRRESSRYGTWRLKLHRPAQEFQRPKGAASYWPQCGVLEVNAWPVNVDGKTESSVLSRASGKARSTFSTWTPTSPLGKASAAFGWAQAPWSARGHGLRVARLVCDQRVGTACPVSGPTRAGWRCAVNTCMSH